MREEAAKKARRRKVLVQGGVIVGILVVLAVIGAFIFNGVNAASTVANPKNMLSGGILLTASDKAVTTPAIAKGAEPTPTKQTLDGKTAHIQIWLDYQCPYCNQFETTNAPQIKQWMSDGAATLEIHPVAILDSATNHNYSTRAAAAAACVAQYDPNKFFDVNSALYANQPDEQTGTGLTNAQILTVFKNAGASLAGAHELRQRPAVRQVRHGPHPVGGEQLAAARRERIRNADGVRQRPALRGRIHGCVPVRDVRADRRLERRKQRLGHVPDAGAEEVGSRRPIALVGRSRSSVSFEWARIAVRP